MRKTLWMLPMALLILVLGSTSALADGTDVFNGGGDVTAIDGITPSVTAIDINAQGM
jgi:hypothetical protein